MRKDDLRVIGYCDFERTDYIIGSLFTLKFDVSLKLYLEMCCANCGHINLQNSIF